MKKILFTQIAESFGFTLDQIREIEKTSKKTILQEFKKGDILACFAGYPNEELCIIELKKEVDIDNFSQCITGASYIPSTSHIISSKWFKIN